MNTIPFLIELMPRARVRVLTLLLGCDEDLYLREVGRLARVPLRAAQRELEMLERIGLVARHPRGRQVFFSVQKDHPLFLGLRTLVGEEATGGAIELAAGRVATRGARRPAAGVSDARQKSARASAEKTAAGTPGSPPGPPRADSWRVW
jgi:hypothetical protein